MQAIKDVHTILRIGGGGMSVVLIPTTRSLTIWRWPRQGSNQHAIQHYND
jgi:hypothetical protein